MAFEKPVKAILEDRKFAPGTAPGQYVVVAVDSFGNPVYQDVQDEGVNSDGWTWGEGDVAIVIPLPAAGSYSVDLYRNTIEGNVLVDVDGQAAHYSVTVSVDEPALVTIRVPVSLEVVG